MFYFLCLIQQDGGIVHGKDMRSKELDASRTQCSPCNPLTSSHARRQSWQFLTALEGALACLAVSSMESRPLRKWKPPDSRDGLGKILKEGLDCSCNAVKDAIEMTPAFHHPVARLVMPELLATNKIVIMALFATKIPSYYDKLLAKTGGENPLVQSKAACWALVTKLMRTIFIDVHQVRCVASEAVLLGADSLRANGMFLYAVVGGGGAMSSMGV
jgi:hypothetical protein